MMDKTVILRKAVNSRRKLRLRKVESPWSETGFKNMALSKIVLVREKPKQERRR